METSNPIWTAAFWGAIGTTLGAIIGVLGARHTILLKHRLDLKREQEAKQKPAPVKKNPSVERLNGSFKGAVVQRLNDQDETCECDLELTVIEDDPIKDFPELVKNSDGQLKGKITLTYNTNVSDPERIQKIHVYGVLHYGFLLTLIYRNVKDTKYQAGTITLIASTKADITLSGNFSGYGPITVGLGECVGTLTLKKIYS